MDNLLILIILIFNFFLFSQNDLISNKINLFDLPDNNRKIHSKKIALTGGVFIFVNFIIFISIPFISFFNNLNFIFQLKRELFSLVFLITLLFLVGLYDDKYNINPLKKFVLSGFIILVALLIDENLILSELNFYTANYKLNLLNLSIPFTLLSILLFLNALNMFDGIDLQVSTYIFLIFIFIIFRFNAHFLILLLPVFLFIIYYNSKKKIFLGDSGTNILAGLVSFYIIKFYNSNVNIVYCEEIFLIMLLPGVDMLRLFVMRISKGKNPFYPDNQHIHHLYLKKFSNNLTFFIIQLHIFIPIILYYYLKIQILFLICFSLILYILAIFYLKHKIKN